MSTPLPLRPNLEHLKKQAKDLLNAHKSTGLDAARRIKGHLPKYSTLSEQEILEASFSLREAQQVIAREYGFASWQKLKAAVSSAKQVAPLPEEGELESLPIENPPSYDEDSLIPVEISGIYPTFSHNSSSFMIYLKGEGDKAIAIVIGHLEGRALALTLENRVLPRPLAHHVLQNILESLDGVIDRLVVHALKDAVYFSHLLIHNQEKAINIDCRPSDGMIIASQNQAPLYTTSEVMEECGKSLEELDAGRKKMTEDELDRWKEEGFLDQRDLVTEASLTVDEVIEYTGIDGHALLGLINQRKVKAFRTAEDSEVHVEKQSLIDYYEKRDQPVPEALQGR